MTWCSGPVPTLRLVPQMCARPHGEHGLGLQPQRAHPGPDSAQAAQGAFRSLDIGHPKPMSQVLLREALQVQAARPKRTCTLMGLD